MSDLDKLAQLIQNITLSSDNKERKECELILQKAKETSIDQYFTLMFQLLRTSSNKQIRSFCAFTMKKQFSALSDPDASSAWEKISGQTAKLIKDEIFIALRDETTSSVRIQICNLIGELGATIFILEVDSQVRFENKSWPELLGRIQELWLSNIDTMMEAALLILSVLFPYAENRFSLLSKSSHTMFKTGMEHDSIEIKAAALNAMSSWLGTCGLKMCKPFEKLIPLMMDTLLVVLAGNEDKGQECLTSIIDVVEGEPKFFRQNFKYVFETMEKICSVKDVKNEEIKLLAVQVIMSMMERIPKIFKDNLDLCKRFMEMTFFIMIETTENATMEWNCPKEGFQEDHFFDKDDEGRAKFGMNVIDQIIAIIGQKKILPIFSGMVQEMMGCSDWRFRFVGLMSLSQIGEHVTDVNDVAPIIELAIKFLNDNHPKIRYAACHLIGQIADDLQPSFQIKFHSQVLPALLNKYSEEVPRVLSHVLAATLNFVNGLPKDLLKGYIETILNATLPLVQKGISIVRENAVATFSAVAEAAEELYQPYFERSVPIIYEIMKTSDQPMYRKLRGLCIECITLMCESVGKDYFKKYANEIIELMIQIQKYDVVFDTKDPLIAYLCSGWQRICTVLDDEFVPYLQSVIPPLFKLVEHVLKHPSIPLEQDEEEISLSSMVEEKENIKKKKNTVDLEEVEVAMNMVFFFITKLKKSYIDFVEVTVKVVEIAIQFNYCEKVRTLAATCMPALIAVVKESTHPKKQELKISLSHAFIEALWKAVSTENDPEHMSLQLGFMGDILFACENFMTKDQVDKFSELILKSLKKSDLRKNENEKYKEEEGCDEEQVLERALESDKEDDLQFALARLIGLLFTTHKELALPLVSIISNEVIIKALQPGLSDKVHKCGLVIIGGMVQGLDIELIPNEWPKFAEYLLTYATDQTCSVRRTALQGIGTLSIKNKAAFSKLAESCAAKVLAALKLPKRNENIKEYLQTREICTLILGRIIRYSESKPNIEVLIAEWLTLLPIQVVSSEAIQQHELLADLILEGNGNVVFGQDGKRLPMVLKIFAIISETKFINEETTKKMRRILHSLKETKETKVMLETAVKPLEDFLKLKLDRIIENVLS